MNFLIGAAFLAVKVLVGVFILQVALHVFFLGYLVLFLENNKMEEQKEKIIKDIVKKLNEAGTLGDWLHVDCLKKKLLKEHNVQWIEFENGEKEWLQ